MMTTSSRLVCLIALAALACCLAGCGGGGGSAAPDLTLSVTPPDLIGKTGQTINVPVTVTGSGTANTATFDLSFASGSFAPATGAVGDPSIALTGLPADCVCRYKWVDAQKIRVMYASATGVDAGGVLVQIPVKVLAETDSALTTVNVAVNQ